MLFAIIALREAGLLRFTQETQYVIISEVAKDPLYPDSVILDLIGELLQSFMVVVARLRTELLCLFDLHD